MLNATTDPDLEFSWRVHHDRLAPGLVGYLCAQGVEHPADLVVPLMLDAARRTQLRGAGGPRAFRVALFEVAHRAITRARRRHGAGPHDLETPMLLDPLTVPERDVLLLRVIAGLTVDQTAGVVGRSRRCVATLERRAIDELAATVAPGPPPSATDLAALIAGNGFPDDDALLPLAAALEALRTTYVTAAPTHVADQHVAAMMDARAQAPAVLV